ncbi:site-specific integrase [Vogesella indigofera]|uniref:Site-specific integrase n=1 Tax=Vogesella indigofera TaxID=45465 RepID=A0ABT5I3H6_VOGIN|nr:site-specific integrase [Vogesella indigofera]MDC7690659.1 site-specific integrase [Vogesella indigofera]
MTISSYVYQHRNGIYYFRRTIPSALRRQYQTKADLRLSLNTRDPRAALVSARRLAVQCDELFEKLKERDIMFKKPGITDLVGKLSVKLGDLEITDIKPGEEELALKMVEKVAASRAVLSAAVAAPAAAPVSPTFGRVVTEFLSKSVVASGWSTDERYYYQTRMMVWAQLFENVQLDKLNDEKFVEAARLLTHLPARQNKALYVGMDPLQMMRAMVAKAENGENIRPDCISIATFNKYVTMLSALLDWAMSQGYATRNVAKAGKRKDPVHERDKRDDFSKAQVAEMLSSGHFQRQEYQKVWQFFIPLIAIYTGARQSEIAQLNTDDIVEEDGVWGMTISPGSDGDKRVKNHSSRRFVPFHDAIIGAGILDYHKERQESGHEKLFFDERVNYGDTVNKWFNRTFLKQFNFPNQSKLSFHSLRHTAITQLMEKAACMHEAALTYIKFAVGHSLSGTTENTYLKRVSAQNKLDVLSRLDFGVVVPHFKNTEPKQLSGQDHMSRLELKKQKALARQAKRNA